MTGLARAYAVALTGLEGTVVEVQTHIGPGIVGTTLVGLPDASLREAKERVRAALFSCGIPTLNRRITVNLSPADLPKTGSGFDLGIAVSMLVARGVITHECASGTVFAAELGLDGSVQAVPGALPVALASSASGYSRLVVAPPMAEQARLVSGLEVVCCAHLLDLLAIFGLPMGAGQTLEWSWEELDAAARTRLADTAPLEHGVVGGSEGGGEGEDDDTDLIEVRGQRFAIEALAVAAIGGHHSLLVGPPGVGKTMLATRMRAILPDLDETEALEATGLRSLIGAGGHSASLMRRPPLEQPHHSATVPALIGGGNPVRPGAVSLAHGGVLLLDEAPEFSVRALDALRQPLENHSVSVHRANASVTFPARFQLVMTANPCPCGGAVRAGEDACRCSHVQKARYWSRLSGPLLDRIDLRLHVGRPNLLEADSSPPLSTAEVRERVRDGRQRSSKRWSDYPWSHNAAVPGKFLRDNSGLPQEYMRAIEDQVDRGILSLRGADRILRLAWSSADFNGNAIPTPSDLANAFDLRGEERGI